jgi:hypothetical protein
MKIPEFCCYENRGVRRTIPRTMVKLVLRIEVYGNGAPLEFFKNWEVQRCL